MPVSTLRGAAVLLALSAGLPALAQSARPTATAPDQEPGASAATAAGASASSGAAALKLMRDKGVITQAEFDAAVAATPATPPAAVTTTEVVVVKETRKEPPPITSKWTASIYGFVEADFIYDSTQSFADLAGNNPIAQPGTYAYTHKRLQFSLRNTRLGFRFAAPEWGGIKSSAVLEMDFFGNQPSGSEAAFYNNPGLRIRHAYLKLETPIVDVLAGQTWELFGWQSHFHPNTVNLQGVPGQVFSRTAQLRVSRTFRTDPVSIDVAVAASRPPQRDAYVPDLQGGLKVSLNNWKGIATAGGTGTSVVPAAIGVSGTYRRFQVNMPYPANGNGSEVTTGWGYSVDALIPIIPVRGDSRANGLTLTGSFVNGYGISDLYTGLNGGIGIAPTPQFPSSYAPNIDSGLVGFWQDGSVHAIAWRSYIVGLQYYLPPSGRFWISANNSDMYSQNATAFAYGSNNKVFDRSHYADGNLFWDATNAVRFGLAYAWFRQYFVNGAQATDNRVQLSTYFLF